MSSFSMSFEDQVQSISTPDRVETSIGELVFADGAPTSGTAERVYDYLDTARGVEVFLNAMPGASVQALVRGPEALGQHRSNQVVIFDDLMDSESLFLTGNTAVPDWEHVDLVRVSKGGSRCRWPHGGRGSARDAGGVQ